MKITLATAASDSATIIGLTGGIASGKSTVARFLRGEGIAVIDVDQLAREVVAPGQPALAEIMSHFGATAVLPDGTLNRKWLGEKVFSSPAELRILNGITHPRIGELIERDLKAHRARSSSPVVLDHPLLFETGHDQMVDMIIVVTVDAATQTRRLMQRNQLTARAAAARIGSQLDLAEKARRADIVIDNSKSVEELHREVRALASRIRDSGQWRSLPTDRSADGGQGA